ncbi:MAG: hypothetical protein ACSHXD_08400 [Marinosulfonomonas sp.]
MKFMFSFAAAVIILAACSVDPQEAQMQEDPVTLDSPAQPAK